VRVALLGDLHEHWTARDVEIIDGAGYDLALFVGDLADPLHRRTLEVAGRIARLRTPALLLPGNHDGTTPGGVLAEAFKVGTERPGSGARGVARIEALEAALRPVALAGYSLHPFPAHGITIVAARPHAMDGARLCFAPLIRARFGISSLEESAIRLRSLVDEAEGDLVFLAHNGPTGLGTDAAAPFAVLGRDLGDPDLAEAVRHAKVNGRSVLAVLAGHVHHRGGRRWLLDLDGTVYVNAARVPRVFVQDGVEVRQHLELVLAGGRAAVREVDVASPTQ
jgi:uncharacterized protein (TIGR04168 family)